MTNTHLLRQYIAEGERLVADLRATQPSHERLNRENALLGWIEPNYAGTRWDGPIPLLLAAAREADAMREQLRQSREAFQISARIPSVDSRLREKLVSDAATRSLVQAEFVRDAARAEVARLREVLRVAQAAMNVAMDDMPDHCPAWNELSAAGEQCDAALAATPPAAEAIKRTIVATGEILCCPRRDCLFMLLGDGESTCVLVNCERVPAAEAATPTSDERRESEGP